MDPERDARIEHAVRVFGLRPAERRIVEQLLVAAWDAPIRIRDLLEVLALDRVACLEALGTSAPLRRYALVDIDDRLPWSDRPIALADDFWPRLASVRDDSPPQPEYALRRLDELHLAGDIATRADELVAWMTETFDATLCVHGPAGSGREAVASAFVAELGAGRLRVDGTRLTPAMLPAWRRELAWHEAVPVIVDADRSDPAALAALVREARGPVFTTATDPIAERLLAPRRSLRVFELPAVDVRERESIWLSALADHGLDTKEIDATSLAKRFRFSPQRVVSIASSLAADPVVTTERVVALCRDVPELRVGGLASRLPTPWRWSDLVVPHAVTCELRLIEAWGRGGVGLPREPRGLACLFHGTPGTGKTFAAQVIAGELGLDLYRVDLSQVVDKYIGETEKRLDTVLREAAAAGAMLLFDEADALFARRTEVRDARDRWANLQTSFLLQRLEDHAGITLLASNARGNIDVAFQRRLAVIVEFPMPGPTERRRIWEVHLPSSARAAIDLELLSQAIPLSGGDIRNVVFGASLIARTFREPLAMKHVAIAVWREMQRAGRMYDLQTLGAWRADVLAYMQGGA